MPQPIHQVEFIAFKIFAVVIGQVGRGDGGAPFAGATVGFQFPVDDLKESGGCDGVTADECDLVAFLDIELYFAEKGFAVNGFGEIIHLQYLVAHFPLLLENDTRIFPVAGRDVFKDQFVQCLFPRSGLLGFGSVCAEPCDEFQQVLFLVFHLLVLIRSLPCRELRTLIPERVVARIDLYLLLVNVRNVRAYAVQEVTVVAYHQHDILVVGQEIFEPGYRLHVKVIGRLIQQQDIGVAKERLRQQYPHFDVGGNILHQLLVHAVVHTQFTEQGRRVAFGGIAAHLAKIVFQFTGLQAVGFGKIFFGINGIAFMHQFPQFTMPHEHGIQYRHFIKLELVLIQYRHAFTRSDINGTLVGFYLAADDLHEGGLARTVGTNDPVTVALGETDIHFIEQNPLAIGQGYIICTYHNY